MLQAPVVSVLSSAGSGLRNVGRPHGLHGLVAQPHPFWSFFPIIAAVELWGEQLRNHQVIFWSDNMSVVQVVNKQSASSPPVVSLLRFLVPKCLHFNIYIKAKHVPGVSNDIADALSRQQFLLFRSLAPSASLEGLPCLAHLWNLVSGDC